ncbi:MAG TPA: cytochrome P450 [Acidimicrobiia bacterium]
MTDTGYLPAMLNPFEPGFFDDPYSQYKRVRDVDPIHRTALGPWALFRHADILRVLRDPNLSVEEENALPLAVDIDPELRARIEERRGRYAASMLDRDPPDHHRLRRLVSKVFTPRMIEELRPRINAIVAEHLDTIAGRGGDADVIADLAFPLPFIVISEMMGIPEGRDRNDLRVWSGQVVKTFDPIITNDDTLAALNASTEIFAFLEEVIAAKRAEPADDLTSALIAAEEDGDRLSTNELVSQIALLFIAGHETTVNLIGNGVLALLEHPEQLALLRDDPSLDVNAVDELLRYDGPVQFTRRIALDDIDVDGHTIESGSVIMTCLGAGNHDPAMFGPTADALDLRRADANQHLTFGGGFHHCLGNALARVEAQEAIGGLIRRFPDLARASDESEWNGRIVIRGLNALPVHI